MHAISFRMTRIKDKMHSESRIFRLVECIKNKLSLQNRESEKVSRQNAVFDRVAERTDGWMDGTFIGSVNELRQLAADIGGN